MRVAAAALAGRATKWTDSDGNTITTTIDTAAYVMAWYLVVFIIWAAYFFLVYGIAFVVYFLKERKRKHQDMQFRTGHIFWKAFCVTSGLWFWILVSQKCGCWGADGARHRSASGGDKSGLLDGSISIYSQAENGVGAQQQQQRQMGYTGSVGLYQHPHQQRPLQGTPPQVYDTPSVHLQAYSAELH